MSESLINKYRPVTFDEVSGHDAVLAPLRRAMASASHPHAYLLTGIRGTGKSQPLDAPILTPNGWITMGDVEVGMSVIGADGRPTEVVGVYDQGEQSVVRLYFRGGGQVDCCENHLWEVWKTSHNKYESSVIPARFLTPDDSKNQWYVRNVKPVQFAPQDIPLDPYVYGVVLGDGYLADNSGCSITTNSLDADEVFERLQQAIPSITKADHTPTTKRIYIQRKYVQWIGAARSANKEIDNRYLYNTVEVRKAVLAGLLDTDGTVSFSKSGCRVSFSTSSGSLALGVIELVQGLGGLASGSLYNRSKGPEFSIRLRLSWNPFRRKYKAARWSAPNSHLYYHRKIIGKESLGHKTCRCIAVASPEQLYVTQDYILTHNTSIGRIIGRYFDADIIEVDAASHSGVAEARLIAEEGQYMSMHGQGIKMYLIDEAHRLSRNAWDALLKIVEEPPAHLYITLCTTEPSRVPPTISSRCYKVELKPLDVITMRAYLTLIAELEGWTVNAEVMSAVISAADGSPREGLTLLQSVHDAPTKEEARRVITLIDASNPIIELMQFLLKGGVNWNVIRKHLSRIDDDVFTDESGLIGVGRYLMAAMRRGETEAEAHRAWVLLNTLMVPKRGFDNKALFYAALGQIVWEKGHAYGATNSV